MPVVTPKPATGANGLRRISRAQSKLGRTNVVASHRIALLFTYNTTFGADVDTQTGGDLVNGAATTDVGFGFAKGTQSKFAQLGTASVGDPREILVGAGFQRFDLEQRIAVEQVHDLGRFDLVETVEHMVDSNTFTVEKIALLYRTLASIGIAPYGKDVLASPAINCYISTPRRVRPVRTSAS